MSNLFFHAEDDSEKQRQSRSAFLMGLGRGCFVNVISFLTCHRVRQSMEFLNEGRIIPVRAELIYCAFDGEISVKITRYSGDEPIGYIYVPLKEFEEQPCRIVTDSILIDKEITAELIDTMTKLLSRHKITKLNNVLTGKDIEVPDLMGDFLRKFVTVEDEDLDDDRDETESQHS